MTQPNLCRVAVSVFSVGIHVQYVESTLALVLCHVGNLS